MAIRSGRRWAGAWLAFAAVTSLLTGCGRSSGGAGSGDRIDYCAGYPTVDQLPEPRPVRSEVLEWAAAVERIVERVDERRELNVRDDVETPGDEALRITDDQQADLETIEEELEGLSEALDSAGSEAEVRAVLDEFSRNDAFNAAMDRWSTFFHATCEDD